MTRDQPKPTPGSEDGSYLPYAVQLLGLPKRRHAQVVYLYLRGHSWPQVGRCLGISEHTAKNYMQTAHVFLGVSYAFEVTRLGYDRLCAAMCRDGRRPVLDRWLADLVALPLPPPPLPRRRAESTCVSRAAVSTQARPPGSLPTSPRWHVRVPSLRARTIHRRCPNTPWNAPRRSATLRAVAKEEKAGRTDT